MSSKEPSSSRSKASPIARTAPRNEKIQLSAKWTTSSPPPTHLEAKARALEHRRQIRCKKFFEVAGNHDKEARKLLRSSSWLGNLAEISVKGNQLCLVTSHARLELCPSRIVAPVWTLTWTIAGDADVTVHGCRGGHPRLSPVAFRPISVHQFTIIRVAINLFPA